MLRFLNKPKTKAVDFLRFSLLAMLLTALSGTRACQEDYFFATQSNLGSSSASSESEESSSTTSASSSVSVSSKSSFSSVSVSSTVSSILSSAASSATSPSSTAGAQVSKVMPLLAELERLSEDKSHFPSLGETQTKGRGMVSNWLSNLSGKKKRLESDKPSRLGADSDGDGFTDGLEYRLGSDWRDPDSVPAVPGDGSLARLRAEDRDLDGISDKQEVKVGTNPAVGDSDGDGVSDGAELLSGTDPLDRSSRPQDADGDGLSDEYEASIGTDPLSPDSDSDGLRDDAEIALHTGPLNKDTDNDGVLDGKEMDLGLDALKPDY